MQLKRSLVVLFYLSSSFGEARDSHYKFMLEGLKETAGVLKKNNIGFYLLGYRRFSNSGTFSSAAGTEIAAPKIIAETARALKGAALIVDFDPLKVKRKWNAAVAAELSIPIYEVDSRNVVPLWIASNKQEYAARTIRPKVLKLLPAYLEPFPQLSKHPFPPAAKSANSIAQLKHCISWEAADAVIGALPSGPDVSWVSPGAKAAARQLTEFLDNKLEGYAENRNDPNKAATSMFSPYLHFGQIAAGRIALEVDRAAKDGAAAWEAADTFLEEMIVRRELADNFCFHNSNYDSVDGFPDWGMKTLNKHRYDERPYLYSREQLEAGETHDDLWNTAQRRLTSKGTMHGFLRMYWAKKILEWTESPEEAMEYCLEFNDSYQLDGRDPNGYTGIAWAIGGVHDRPWKEREVFGTVRYMNYKGCKRKFDVAAYVENGGEPELL